MKALFLLIVAVVLGVFAIFAYLPANSVRACYSTKQKELDELAFRLQSQVKSDTYSICTASYRIIEELSTCVTDARNTVPEALRSNFLPLVDNLVGMLRYQQNDVSALRNRHDETCSEHPDFMFTPPEYLINSN